MHALAHSQMRVGPLGLLTLLNADYFILNSSEYVGQAYLQTQEPLDLPRRLSKNTQIGIRGWPHGSRQPRIPSYVTSYKNIDFLQYDFVFCINDPIPPRLRHRAHQSGTIFISIPFDGILPDSFFGYTALTTQYTSTSYSHYSRILDIPYTFLGPYCLQNLLDNFNQNHEPPSKSLYLEINNCTKRPASPNHYSELSAACSKIGWNITTHAEYILENLRRIAGSMFFVKYQGRPIRGNSIIESISAGTPVLINPDLYLDNLPRPSRCLIQSQDDILSILTMSNLSEWRAKLLADQRAALSTHVVQQGCLQLLRLLSLAKGINSKPLPFRLLKHFKDLLRLKAYKISEPLFREGSSYSP